MPYEAPRRVETTTRSFEIIEYLRQHGKTGVSTIASELDMNKGIVHNHVSTLRELGYVRKVGSCYGLSPKLFALGIQTRASSELYQYSTGVLEDFASRFDVGVVLVQQTENECVVIAAHGLAATTDVGVGTILSRFSSLVGVVTLDSEEYESQLSETVYEDIFMQLDTKGYAAGPLSETDQTQYIAFPVRDESGICRGSVGILPGDDETQTQLVESLGTLRNRIEDRFETEWTAERSFATEKHSWVWE